MIKVALIEKDIDVYDKVLELFGESKGGFALQKFEDCSSMIDKLEETYPQIILMATSNNSNQIFDSLHEIKNIFPDIPVIITNENGMTDSVLGALKIGAIGYCPADFIDEYLLQMLDEAVAGMAEMPEQLADLLASPFSGLKDKLLERTNNLFTTKELIILTLIKDKTGYDKIAVTLNTSVDKIKFQIRNIYRKLHSFYMSADVRFN